MPKFLLQLSHDCKNINFAKMPQKSSIDCKAEKVHAHQKADLEDIGFNVSYGSFKVPDWKFDISELISIGAKIGHNDQEQVSKRVDTFSFT